MASLICLLQDNRFRKHIMDKHIVIVGFGNLGQAIQPLLKKVFPGYPVIAFDREADPQRRQVAQEMGVQFHHQEITQHNYQQVLAPLLTEGSYLLNIAVEVSTIDLIDLAQTQQAFYLDAGIEPWAYQDDSANAMISNYALREEVLAFARMRQGRRTAVIAQGANPGFVSVLVKCALESMAQRHAPDCLPATMERADWGRIAERLGVRVIQISECDTQVSNVRAGPDEFVNTWSVDGLITEALQSAEAGWGTHECTLPPGASTHEQGCRAAIMLNVPGANVSVRSWSPNRLEFTGFMITHNEAISIADFLTVHQQGRASYRPTVYYAYRPCDETVSGMKLIAGGDDSLVKARRVAKDDVMSGIDELGVFLISEYYPALWLGSNLSIGRTRAIAPYNNATSLQVVASLVGAMKWIGDHANLGIIESEDLDHRAMYEFVSPYWGPMLCETTHWKPGSDLQFASFRSQQMPEPGQVIAPGQQVLER